MSRLTLLSHLKDCAQRAKAFSGKLTSDLAGAVTEAVGEVSGRLTAHTGDTAAHVSKEDREKWNKSCGGSGFECYVISTRVRDPSKPDFGIGGVIEKSAALEVGTYTGNAEISAVVNGVEYDAENIYQNGDNAPDGALIINQNY